jgi:hypothetical protein
MPRHWQVQPVAYVPLTTAAWLVQSVAFVQVSEQLGGTPE